MNIQKLINAQVDINRALFLAGSIDDQKTLERLGQTKEQAIKSAKKCAEDALKSLKEFDAEHSNRPATVEYVKRG